MIMKNLLKNKEINQLLSSQDVSEINELNEINYKLVSSFKNSEGIVLSIINDE